MYKRQAKQGAEKGAVAGAKQGASQGAVAGATLAAQQAAVTGAKHIREFLCIPCFTASDAMVR